MVYSLYHHSVLVHTGVSDKAGLGSPKIDISCFLMPHHQKKRHKGVTVSFNYMFYQLKE